jgi:hypothetical protein
MSKALESAKFFRPPTLTEGGGAFERLGLFHCFDNAVYGVGSKSFKFVYCECRMLVNVWEVLF